MKQQGRLNYVPGSNRNYEPIWYDADHPTMKPISAHMDIERRITERFAWLPRRMDDDTMVWFKPYVIIEKFVNTGPTQRVLYINCYTQDHYIEMKLKGIVN
jgi:hypothetical protein